MGSTHGKVILTKLITDIKAQNGLWFSQDLNKYLYKIIKVLGLLFFLQPDFLSLL